MSRKSASPPVRRTQAARTAQSRGRLLRAARAAFEKHGFAGAGTEAILAEAELTRGALYHHYADKAALFESVCEAAHAELGAAIEKATAGLAPGVDALVAGALAWIEAIAEPGRARILLIDAPAVLGPKRWAELDRRHGMARLRDGLAAARGGRAAPEAACVALNGAINELARWRAGATPAGPAQARAVRAALTAFCAAAVQSV